MQRLQAAAKREGKQHGDFNGQRQPPEAGACDGVIRGLLVRREFKSIGKLRRDGGAMRQYVANLALG